MNLSCILLSYLVFIIVAVALPEPVKMRETEPVEEKKLSDFQQDLVLLAETLKGDHKKDIFLNKLADNMTVVEAVNYVEEAFNKFLGDCEKAKQGGAHESHITCLERPQPKREFKSFAQKLFSCLICDH